MCETLNCKAKGRFWVRRDSANLIVCGRHLAGEVKRLHDWNHLTAHPSYNLTPGSSVVVKMKSELGAWR